MIIITLPDILIQNMMDRLDDNRVVDVFFNECYKKVRDQSVGELVYYTIRLVALALILPVNVITYNANDS